MNKYEKYTDEELIILMQGNDGLAEESLLNKYKAVVRKKVRAMYLVGGETDDLIQEGMIGLFKAVRDYRADKAASFVTFAGLCIDRQLYNAIQSSNRKKHGPLNSYVSLSGDEFENELKQLSEQSPEAIVIARENIKGIQRRIKEKLSTFENEVLKSYLEGNDYIQIADMLKREPKSIDNALQRIRAKVKVCLNSENQ
jgi:RNA polymerase sigma factor, sigma-70 family